MVDVDAPRHAPSDVMLLPVLAELNVAGVKDENVTVIFGCGTHRAVTDEEARRLLGDEACRRVKAVSHDCRANDLVHVGNTRTHGNKVYLNRVFAESDVKILLGDVGFHYYAGYGGGRNSVLPAVAGEEKIKHKHAMLLNPDARTGICGGKPAHKGMTEGARLAKGDFIVNTVSNSKCEIVKAFAGDVDQAFMERVTDVDEMSK